MSSSANPSFVLIGAGLIAHVYFHKREPASLSGYAALLIGVPTTLGAVFFIQESFSRLRQSIIFSIVLYLATLLVSVATYRLSPFHPLAKYPGPAIGKVTRFWALYKALGHKQHIYFQELHEKYGNVVRTGPDHLIIRDVQAITKILGPGPVESRWIRGRKYGLSKSRHGDGSLVELIYPSEQVPRRRIWDRAFTPNALKDYEPALEQRASQLVDALLQRRGQIIDLGAWYNYFTFDFMGDFGLASTFNFLEKGTDDGFIGTLEVGIRRWEIMGTIPWIHVVYRGLIPLLAKEQIAFGERILLKRKAEGGSIRKDILYHLLDEDGTSGHEPLPLDVLISDSLLTTVAGSDTTAIVLSNVFFYLLTNPDTFLRLREELDQAIPRQVQFPDSAVLAKLPFLQAIINETLRLQPAVPCGSQRCPPPNGAPVIIGDIVIPPGTTVQVPTWSLHRDPRYFWPHPESFYPDRWLVDAKELSREEFRLNTTAFTPFSYGPTSCVGKQLALVELRLIVATIARSFDMKLDPTWDPRRWEEDLREGFLLLKGKLPVIVEPRAT